MSKRVSAGDVLAGKYRVERVLGSGGMGVVVAAWHLQLDVLVALKFMADEALTDVELASRFLREARAAARLRSEHVARVMDFGTLEWGAPYLVMEYLEGSDLADIMRGGPQPIPSAVEFLVQACDALDEAHRLGIVHRDVKPSNLFLTTRSNRQFCVKVLDFGISKIERLGSSTSKLRATQPSALLGSPFYMAPEQMRAARDVDLRADIWALGATLYELLTGRVPFEAKTLLDLALHVANSDPVPPRNIRPQIPWALEQIVLRCLQKDPDDRFTSARALANALAPFSHFRDGLSRRVASPRPWFEELVTHADDEDVTRVASGQEAADEPTAQPLDTVSPHALGLPNAVRTLPMAAPLQSSVPPVAQNALRGWRTGARLSWGKSYPLLGKNAQATLRAFGAGFVVSIGLVAVLVLRSEPRLRSSNVTPSAAMVSPPLPAAPSTIVTEPQKKDPKAREAAEPRDLSTHYPAVSAADLHNPSSPVPTPPRPRPRLLPAPSSASAAIHAKVDAGPPAAASSQAAPSPLDDFERNPYVR